MKSHCSLQTVAAFFPTIATFFFSVAAIPLNTHADIATDGSLGAAGALSGPAYTIDASLGRVVGSNLFHSFERFSINASESATFTGPTTINHVISRVTGGLPSTIDGNLQDSFSQADFYFINPAGVIFGANASLNVSGSFFVSSADYLRLSDGNRFITTSPTDGVTLTTAAPQAFGFIDDDIAPVIIEGSSLSVTENHRLAIAAGDILISGAQLAAPQGDIQLVSSATAGEIIIESEQLNAEPMAQFGAVQLIGSQLITAGANGAGDIAIRAGELVVDNSFVLAYTSGASNAGDISVTSDVIDISNGSLISTESFGGGDAGDVSIKADSVELSGESANIPGAVTAIRTAAEAGSVGNAGDITIEANRLALMDGAELRTQSLSDGTAGNIHLQLTDSLVLQGETSIGRTSRIIASAGGPGLTGLHSDSGNITIITTDMTVENGGLILSRNYGQGKGGSITISAEDTINLSGISTQRSIWSAIGTEANIEGGQGNAGSINITAKNLSLADGASISADAFDGGNSGNINIQLTDSLTLKGIASNGINFFKPFISANTANGSGGELTIQAKDAQLFDGSQIETITVGSGDGGTLTLDIEDLLLIDGFSPDDGSSGVFSIGDSTSSGQAGDILIAAGDVHIRNGGVILSNAFGIGNGGNIQLTIDGKLEIEGNLSTELPNLDIAGLGGLIETSTRTDGLAGDLMITAEEVVLKDGARLNTFTLGAGRAGNIDISAKNLLITGRDKSKGSNLSGIVAETIGGSGNGGNINLSIAQLSLQENGVVSSSSSGTGLAGDITINATDWIALASGASISASAEQSDGGNLTVNAVSRLWLKDSKITTSVGAGQGNGGNIRIDPEFVILDNSTIRANAFGGSGGNIFIAADQFIASPDSVVEAVAKDPTGIDGTVVIDSPDRDISKRIKRQSLTFNNPNLVLSSQCSPPILGDLIKLRVIPANSLYTKIPQALRVSLYGNVDQPYHKSDSYTLDQPAIDNNLLCFVNL